MYSFTVGGWLALLPVQCGVWYLKACAAVPCMWPRTTRRPAREKDLDKLDPSRKAARQARKAEAAKLREERERGTAATSLGPGPAEGASHGGAPGAGAGAGAGGVDSPTSPFGGIAVSSLTVFQLNQELMWCASIRKLLLFCV